VAGAFPGTDRTDLEALITTIRGNLGFKELQKIRDNSPTGGAVGQLSDTELKILSSMAGNLDPNQSAGQLKANLKRIKAAYLGMISQKGTTPKGNDTPPTKVWNPETGSFD